MGDRAGYVVSAAGDVNGDDIADIILGAPFADANGDLSGAAHVVFGRSNGFDSNLALSSLDGTNGFQISGAGVNDRAGGSVSLAGDINNDGFDDILVVTSGRLGTDDRGEAYVVFGKASGFPNDLNLASLDGSNGFKIVPGSLQMMSDTKSAVSLAGDVNGDGVDDFLVAGFGAIAVVFGKNNFPSVLDLSTLNGDNGFVIGHPEGGGIGFSGVANAGDINGDGLDDILVRYAGYKGSYEVGQVIFGRSGGFPGFIDGSKLDGSNGFTIVARGAYWGSLFHLSAAGDVNDDGYDDIVVGSAYDFEYIIYGKQTAATVGGDTLTGSPGQDTLSGLDGNDLLFGMNGDDWLTGGAGVDTLVGGAGNDSYEISDLTDILTEDAGGGSDTIVVSFSVALASVDHIENITLAGSAALNGTGDDGANVLTGNTGINILDALGGDDTLAGGGGSDTLIGGAGNDTYLADADDTILETDGEGTDTVKSSVTLTLAQNVENLELLGKAALSGTGNESDNRMTGNGGTNTLAGGAGHDILFGLEGADTLFGGSGNDTLDGGIGKDRLVGGTGNDTYRVFGRDKIIEDSDGGIDTLITNETTVLDPNIENLVLTGDGWRTNGTGNSRDNSIKGNKDDDRLFGLDGNDFLYGGDGRDNLIGGSGRDRLVGGKGSDTYIVDKNDKIIEKAKEGFDTVTSSETYELGDNVENLELIGKASINGTGNEIGNTLIGNSGNNILNGLGGNDSIDGGFGRNILYGGAGDDLLSGSYGGAESVYYGGTGNDRIVGGISYDWSEKSDSFFGGAGDDRINGSNQEDYIVGGDGMDSLSGGNGDDTYVIDGSDTIFESSFGGTDTVRSSVSFTLSANIENLTLTGSDAINGTGHDGANSLTGNGGANTLDGRDGNDTLDGGGGNDRLNGGDGNDRAVGGGGNDRIEGGGGNDTLDGGKGADSLVGGSGRDILVGEAGDDLLDGGAGDDVLLGWTGRDVMTGGSGVDVFVFANRPVAGKADTITDFNAAREGILLEGSVFTGLAEGDLAPTAFARNTSGRAQDASDRIIYETDTGKLWYDRDGTGSADRVHFATLDRNLALQSDNFAVFFV